MGKGDEWEAEGFLAGGRPRRSGKRRQERASRMRPAPFESGDRPEDCPSALSL